MAFPIIQFSGIYYPQAFVDLVLWKRVNAPELTDEDPHEPSMQMLSAFALAFHYNNVLLDYIAMETLLPTAALRESVRAHLLLIGRKLVEATAASTDLVFTLSSPITTSFTIPGNLLAATQTTLSNPEIIFETPAEDIAMLRTDQVSQAWLYDQAGVGTYTDVTDVVNGTAGTFGWPGNAAANDAVYYGHRDAMFDRISLDPVTPGDLWNANDNYVWEYYDEFRTPIEPTAVTAPGGFLTVNCNSLFGTFDRTGSVVRVASEITGAYEDVSVIFTGGVNQAVVPNELGQAAPSTDVADYAISALWRELPNVEETIGTTSVVVTWDLPEDSRRTWTKTTVNDYEAYYVRLRVTGLSGPVPQPVFEDASISGRRLYLKLLGTQGRTVVDDPIATSDGTSRQAYAATRLGAIDGSMQVDVLESGTYTPYSIVDDFLASGPNSRDCLLEFDRDSRAVVTFGDGTKGKIPPLGADIRLTYRIGADYDGNVGAGAIVVNRGSNLYTSAVTNPRGAVGWNPPEGTTRQGLEDLKNEGPASLRTLERAVTLEDVEELALAFVSEDGSQPVGRALAVEEGYGDRTIKLVVVSPSGSAISTDILAELDLYFNGDPVEGTSGVLVIAVELTTTNFTAVPVDVTATVLGGTQATIEAALTNFLSPMARKPSGVYEHEFNDVIYLNRIIAEIFEADEDVENVVLTTPSADITLTGEELPVVGTLTITVT